MPVASPHLYRSASTSRPGDRVPSTKISAIRQLLTGAVRGGRGLTTALSFAVTALAAALGGIAGRAPSRRDNRRERRLSTLPPLGAIRQKIPGVGSCIRPHCLSQS